MPTPPSIFRDEAIKQYKKRKDKTTLTRFMPFPVTFLLWVLLGLVVLVGVLAWNEEIPIYQTAPGIILDQESPGSTNQHNTVAALFLVGTQAAQIRVGQLALVHIGTSKEELASKVIKVEASAISPNLVRQRYGVVAQVVSQPSIVVLIEMKALPTSTYAGSLVVANVKTGSQRILSLLPGIGSIVRA
ncbi:hypothetical protein KDA_65940 [Dictyobacter alpinus]|uniref:Uncharacterized protein n=1 Tax=Dictyobacter alpinus TaxID=2014873 RepID=A0A402BIE6_9CHLR|nr:hypothetical protein [Dictyobacter alpinus]GCE31110.1 hypothetical protein KDA_65940 [Dictyobacter alpinus]